MDEIFSGFRTSDMLQDLNPSIFKSSIEKYALDFEGAKDKFKIKFNDYVRKIIRNDVDRRVENNGIDIKKINTNITEFTLSRYILPIYIYYDTDGNAMFIQALDLSKAKVYGHKKLSVSKTSLITGGLTLVALAWIPISATGLALFLARFLLVGGVTSTSGFLAKHKQSFMNKLEEKQIFKNKHHLREQIQKNTEINKQLITEEEDAKIEFKRLVKVLTCSNSLNIENSNVTRKNKRKYERGNRLNKSSCLKLLGFNKNSKITIDNINYQYNKCILELQYDDSVTGIIYKLKSDKLDKAKQFLLKIV
jgi:hypothetical protein